MSKYKIELVHDMDAWDKFVDESPQGTIFSQSIYLKLAVHYWNIFWIKKGNQIKGGLAIILDRSKKNVILDDLVIHNGLMFVENKQQKPCSIKSEQFEITEFVIEYLIGEFDTIALSLAPSFRDLRPFLWENYHSKDDSDKFKLDLRYTSTLDISELFLKKRDQNNDLFQQLDGKRQTDIKRAYKNGLKIIDTPSTKDLIRLYRLTMESQGVILESCKLNKIEKLVDGLCNIGMAKKYASINLKNQITYMTVFTKHNHKSYYLFGAGDKKNMDRYDATFCIWNGLKDISSNGVEYIDLEGVNSPKRGWFKLGFGGDIRPYYQVYKNE